MKNDLSYGFENAYGRYVNEQRASDGTPAMGGARRVRGGMACNCLCTCRAANDPIDG